MAAPNPILAMPLNEVLKPEIAHCLECVHIHTVGSLLRAWKNPGNHKRIEDLFDTPEQAVNVVSVCASWTGVKTLPFLPDGHIWWSQGVGAVQ